jgi:hypothetical protein
MVKEQFEQIREQIFEIRKFIGPLDTKLENLDNQISRSRIAFEWKTAQLESRIAEHSTLLALHTDQIRDIEVFAKMPSHRS